MLAGVPYAPISTAYSLLSQAIQAAPHRRPATPGMVFAANRAAYAKAIEAVVPASTPVVLTRGSIEGRRTLAFADPTTTKATSAVDAAGAELVRQADLISATMEDASLFMLSPAEQALLIELLMNVAAGPR